MIFEKRGKKQIYKIVIPAKMGIHLYLLCFSVRKKVYKQVSDIAFPVKGRAEGNFGGLPRFSEDAKDIWV
jgi:hypothetical protein